MLSPGAGSAEGPRSQLPVSNMGRGGRGEENDGRAGGEGQIQILLPKDLCLKSAGELLGTKEQAGP